MACNVIASRLLSTNHNSIADKAISRSCPFKSGVFKLNGAKIRLETGDSLKTIENKINAKQNSTGICAKAIDGRLELCSKKQIVQIVDYDFVLKKFYEQKELGCSDNCLIQIIRAGANPNDVIIKYKAGKSFNQNPSNIVLSGSNNILLAEWGYTDMVAKHSTASNDVRQINNLVYQHNKLKNSAKQTGGDACDFKNATMMQRLLNKARLSMQKQVAAQKPAASSSSNVNTDFASATMMQRLLNKARPSMQRQVVAQKPAASSSSGESFDYASANMVQRLLHKARQSI